MSKVLIIGGIVWLVLSALFVMGLLAARRRRLPSVEEPVTLTPEMLLAPDEVAVPGGTSQAAGGNGQTSVIPSQPPIQSPGRLHPAKVEALTPALVPMRFSKALAGATLVLVVLAVYTAYGIHRTGQDEVLRQFGAMQSLLARECAHDAISHLYESARDLRGLARLPSIQRHDRPQMDAELQSFLRTADHVRLCSIGVVDCDGTVVSVVPTNDAVRKYAGSELLDWAAKKENRGKVFAFPEARQVKGQTGPRQDECLLLATPLYRTEGEAAGGSQNRVWNGALVMSLNLEAILTTHLAETSPKPWSQRVWVLDQDGTILLQTEHPEMTRENIYHTQPQCAQCHVSFDYARQMLTNRTGTAQYQVKNQPRKLAAFAPIRFANASWIAVVNAPYAEVTAYSRRSYARMLLLLGIITVAVCLAALIVHRTNVSRVTAEAETRRWQEKHRLEEQIRRTEERYRTVFEQSPDGIVMMDPETTLPIVFNRAAHRRLGYSRHEFARLRLADYEVADAPTAPQARVQELLRDGGACVETQLRGKTGEIRNVEMITQRLELADRHVLHCIYHDITERKRAETALEWRSAQLEALHRVGLSIAAEMEPGVLLESTIAQAVTLFHGTAGGLFLYRAANDELELVIKSGATPAVVGTRLHKGQGPAGRVWETGTPLVVTDLRCWDNPPAVLQGRACASTIGAPVRWGETFIGVLEICSGVPGFFSQDDATLLGLFATQAAIAIKNAGLIEQVRRDATVKTTLLHDVNHRVKNNLMRLVEIIRLEREQAAPTEDTLSAVLSDLESRLLGMGVVHSMLSSTEWRPLALQELATQIVTAALSGFPIRRQIRVSVVAPTEPLWVVPEQATALALIINELATNSVKHAFRNREHGLMSLRVQLEDQSGGRPRVRLEYRDDGPGWPEAVLSGERGRVGLHLIQASVRSPLRGELTLSNDAGAAAVVSFKLATAE